MHRCGRMDDQNKNLILATALSFLVILVWFLIFPPEEPVSDPNAPSEASQSEQAPEMAVTPPAIAHPNPGSCGQIECSAQTAAVVGLVISFPSCWELTPGDA